MGDVSFRGGKGSGSTAAPSGLSAFSALASNRSVPGVTLLSNQTQILTANFAYYEPFVVGKPITINAAELISNVPASAGGQARLAIYKATPAWVPDVLVSDLGPVPVDVAGVQGVSGLNVVLPAGLYMGRIHTDGAPTQVTLMGNRGVPVTGAILGGTPGNFIYQLRAGLAFGPAETPGTPPSNGTSSSTPSFYGLRYAWTVN